MLHLKSGQGILWASVQPAFNCLSGFFSPSPDPSPSHHPLNSRFGLTGIDFSYILSTPSPNETKIIGDGPTVTPQHYMMCNRAGEGTCLWRGLGTVNVSQRLLRAGHICHGCQNREMSRHFPRGNISSFPMKRVFQLPPCSEDGCL